MQPEHIHKKLSYQNFFPYIADSPAGDHLQEPVLGEHVRAVPARGVQQRLCARHRDSSTQGTAALRQATGQRIRTVSTENTTGWNI